MDEPERRRERERKRARGRKKARNRRKWRSGLNEGKVKSMRGSCKFTGSPLGQVPGPCRLCRNICEGRPLIVCWLSDHYKSRCLMPFLRCKNRDKESESSERQEYMFPQALIERNTISSNSSTTLISHILRYPLKHKNSAHQCLLFHLCLSSCSNYRCLCNCCYIHHSFWYL